MNKEKKITTTRSLEQLVTDFRVSGGSFLIFHGTLNKKERALFKCWLDGMRQPEV